MTPEERIAAVFGEAIESVGQPSSEPLWDRLRTVLLRLGEVLRTTLVDLETLKVAVLAYDDAIRARAHLGQRCIEDDDELDDLYAAMLSAAGRELDTP